MQLLRSLKMKNWLIGLTLLSALVFYIEKYHIRPGRQQTFLNNYLSVLQANLEGFQKDTGLRIEDGDFNRYFYKGSISHRKLMRLKRKHALIEDVAILNKNGALIGQSTNLGKAFKLRKYIRRARGSRGYQQFLHSSGFFRLYPVQDEDRHIIGYILFKLKVPSAYGQNVMVLHNEGRSQLYVTESDYFSAEEKSLLLMSFDEIELDDAGDHRFQLGENYFEAHHRFWRDGGLFLVALKREVKVTQLAGFYMLSVSSLVFLLFLIMQNPAFIHRLTHKKEQEELTGILQNQRETLDTLRTDFAAIKNAYSYGEAELEEREKIIAGRVLEKEEAFEDEEEPDDTLYSYDEAAISEQLTEKDSGTIELKPLKREFIFIAPEDTSWKSDFKTASAFDEFTEEEKEHIDKARGKTFTPEVVELIRDISQSDEKTNLLKQLSVFETMYADVQIRSFITYLNEVYFDEVTIPEIQNLLGMIAKPLKADGMVLLNYNSYLGCYESTVLYNLDEQVHKTFYVLNDDTVVPLKKGEFVFHAVTDEQRLSPFFRKRFTDEIATNLESLYMFSLHDHYLDAFLVAFYFTDQGEVISKSVELEEIKDYLNKMAPALKYFFMEHFTYNLSDQTTEMIKEITTITNKGHSRADVFHVYLEKLINHSDYLLLKKTLVDVLSPEERIIFNSPGLLIAMVLPENSENFYEIMQRELEVKKIEKYEFPDDGNSFYGYF